MFKKNQRNSIVKIKILGLILTIFLIIIPLILANIRFDSKFDINDFNPKINDFTKDDYNPIITEQKHGLGNIIINDIDFSELKEGFYEFNATYPNIGTYISSGALSLKRLNLSFVQTMEHAVIDNLNKSIKDNNIIKVKLNESIFVEHDGSTEGYLICHTRLFPCDLLSFFVDNGTEVFELNIETDYEIDGNDFIVFNFEDYFGNGLPSNFTMYLIWTYELEIDPWHIRQDPEIGLVIENIVQNFTVDFEYYFVLNSQTYNQTILDEEIFADNIYISLTVNLPDKDLLNNHILKLNNVSVNINNHLNLNKTVDILLDDKFSGNQSSFSLSFSSNFTLKFNNALEDIWAIDRLFAQRNIRERIYFPSIINGPQYIYLRYISFNESTIYFDEVIDTYSLFERIVSYSEQNINETEVEGIKVNVPYLILGEICPFTIKYLANQRLKIIITDVIKMPLVGAKVEFYFSGQRYGTYISKDRAQPIPAENTNENGETILNEIPHGNYTIRIYKNGVFIKESLVSTFKNINYIHTDYPHFPLWILIFIIINGIILVFGVIIYLKNKKTR
ncbi:MAG: hypothetical protein ACFE91_04240 [Promethearchaeota archaeon]